MKPETGLYLEKAKSCLDKADGMLAKWPDEAGREAYLASFHAAQALIFEIDGRSYKTHNGVQSEFLRLTKNEDRIDQRLRTFISRSYNLKAIADYETGPDAILDPQRAAASIVEAKQFVEHIAIILAATPQL